MEEHNRKVRTVENSIDHAIAVFIKLVYSGLWVMSNRQFYAYMSAAISKYKKEEYTYEAVRAFMRENKGKNKDKEKIPHNFTYDLLVSSLEDVYTSYIYNERIDKKKRQLAQDRWESHKEVLLKVLADLFEGKNLTKEFKEISPIWSDDFLYTRIVVLFIKGNWPEDESSGLSAQNTELLRLAITSFIPKPIPEDENMRIVRFTKYQWPDDSSNGLTSEQTEQLRAALESFLPAILKSRGLS